MALAAKGVKVRLLNTRGLGVDPPGGRDGAGGRKHPARGARLVPLHQRPPARTRRHRQISARARHSFLPGRHPDARRVSHHGGARGFSRRRRAQMAARPVRRGPVLRQARFAGEIESAGLRLAQRPQPQFHRAGKNRVSRAARRNSRPARTIWSASSACWPRWNWRWKSAWTTSPPNCSRKRAWLVPALQAKGFIVLNPEPKPENAGGITSTFFAGPRPRAAAQETGGCRRHRVTAHGPEGTKLPPLLAALLQHRRRIAARGGAAVKS